MLLNVLEDHLVKTHSCNHLFSMTPAFVAYHPPVFLRLHFNGLKNDLTVGYNWYSAAFYRQRH